MQNKIDAIKKNVSKVLKFFLNGRKKASTREMVFGQELERYLELGSRRKDQHAFQAV